MTLDDDDLTAAVAGGVLSAEKAAQLRAFASARRATPEVDEENIRLISSFNDIFVCVAVVLTLVAIGVLTALVTAWLPGLCVAAASWLMAEYFTRKRMMALPSILLVVTFSAGLGAFGALVLGVAMHPLSHWGLFQSMNGSGTPRFPGSDLSVAVTAGFGLASVGAFVHWLRFHVPITMAVLCASVLAAVIALGAMVFPGLVAWSSEIMLICGLLLFALALRWDASDVQRRTRRSDVAFWLHMIAAPLMVRPVFEMLGLTSGHSATMEAGRAILAIGCYVILAMVALVIDRRALLLSALIYVLYAIFSLLALTGLVTTAFAATGLVIGTTLLLLSVWWRALRAPLVRALPARIRAIVPA